MKTVKYLFPRFGKMLLVLLIVLSAITVSSVNDEFNVNAWDSNVPHGFVRIKNIRYPEWWGRKVPGISGWSTWSTQYDGRWAYCLESSKNTPPEGSYAADVINNNPNVRKMLYYGFGGPNPQGEFQAGYDLKAAICPNDSYLTNDDVKYLLTHIFLSGAYSGDWNGFNEQLFNQYFGGSYGTNIMNIYRRIIALPDPPTPSFSPSPSALGTVAEFTAHVDPATKQQITNTVTFNGKSDAVIRMTLPDNVTIHIAGTTAEKTGGVCEVYAGQGFYFTAPIVNGPDDMPMTDVTGSGCDNFIALAIRTGSATNQTEGSWSWDPNAIRMSMSIDWMEGAEFSINKVDNFGEKISNAEFDLQQWNSSTGTYEYLRDMNYDSSSSTYKTGILVTTDLNQGKFKIIESGVPSGYTQSSAYEQEFTIDGFVERVNINPDMEGSQVNVKISSMIADKNSIMYEVYDVPSSVTVIQFPTWSENGGQDDVDWVRLSKESDGVWRGYKYMSENGVYTIHGYYNTASAVNLNFFGSNVDTTSSGATAVNNRIMGKISVTKTDETSGEKLSNVKFEVFAQNDITSPQGTVELKAGESAGTLTTDSNGYAELDNLLLGTYIVKEIEVPPGYHRAADQTVTLSITDTTAELVTCDLSITNKQNNLKIRKVDKDSGELLKNGYFDIFNITDNKLVGNYATDDNGEINLSKLEPDLYYIQETKQPDGYKLNDEKYYFVINSDGNAEISDRNDAYDDGTFVIDSNGDMTITAKNEINLCNLRIIKENDDGKALEGAEFTLYSDEDCTEEVDVQVSDKNGELTFERIVVGDYYLKETEAPKGYRKILDPIKISLKPVDGKFTFMINDKPIDENDENNTLTIENYLYTGTMTVINEKGSLLPSTGSSMTIMIIGAGCAVMTGVLVYNYKKKKGERYTNED